MPLPRIVGFFFSFYNVTFIIVFSNQWKKSDFQFLFRRENIFCPLNLIGAMTNQMLSWLWK